jgi:hypothetical protein
VLIALARNGSPSLLDAIQAADAQAQAKQRAEQPEAMAAGVREFRAVHVIMPELSETIAVRFAELGDVKSALRFTLCTAVLAQVLRALPPSVRTTAASAAGRLRPRSGADAGDYALVGAMTPSERRGAFASSLFDRASADDSTQHLGLLLPALQADHARDAIDRILQEPLRVRRYRVGEHLEWLNAVVPHLSAPQLADLRRKTQEDDPVATVCLDVVVAALGGPGLDAALSAVTEVDADLRSPLLRQLARPMLTLTPPARTERLLALFDTLVTRPRSDLLDAIADLAQVILSCGGPAARETSRAIDDVGRWWP